MIQVPWWVYGGSLILMCFGGGGLTRWLDAPTWRRLLDDAYSRGFKDGSGERWR